MYAHAIRKQMVARSECRMFARIRCVPRRWRDDDRRADQVRREREICGEGEPVDYVTRSHGVVRTVKVLTDGRQIGGFYAPDIFGLEDGDFHSFGRGTSIRTVRIVRRKSLIGRPTTASHATAADRDLL